MAEFKLPKNSEIVEGKEHPRPKSNGEHKTFKIYRWSPDDDRNPRVDTFTIDKDDCGPMVLDALIKIKSEVDGNLNSVIIYLIYSCYGCNTLHFIG